MTEDPQIPDSISFTDLRKLQAEKGKVLDFSNPKVSQDIGDLAFLFMIFVKEKLGGTYTHQQAFLLNLLVTELRRQYERKAEDLIRQGAAPDAIKVHSKIAATLLVLEGMADSLVSFFMKQMDSQSTLPSYRLVRSLDPSVRPHEIEDWIKEIGRLGF
jgi:hypothetical protein